MVIVVAALRVVPAKVARGVGSDIHRPLATRTIGPKFHGRGQAEAGEHGRDGHGCEFYYDDGDHWGASRTPRGSSTPQTPAIDAGRQRHGSRDALHQRGRVKGDRMMSRARFVIVVLVLLAGAGCA